MANFTQLFLQNERLTQEQDQYIKILLKQSKEFEKKNRSAEKIGKEHVMRALQEKWEACKEEDKKLEGESSHPYHTFNRSPRVSVL